MNTKIFTIVALLIFSVLCLSPAEAAKNAKFTPTVPIMPLKALKKGMTGEARTVLSGTKISKFKVTILGVMPRKTSPKNLILFRTDDPKIVEEGGVAAGMSGSPIYVGGKLVGAIGYGWSFSAKGLGLATPIEEMIKVLDRKDNIPKFRIAPKIPEAPLSADVRIKQMLISGDVISGDVKSADVRIKQMLMSGDIISGDVKSADVTSKDAASNDIIVASDDVSADILSSQSSIQPLMMPLLADGISSGAAKLLGKRLGTMIFPLGSSASTIGVNLGVKLEPGAAIGVVLAWGDVQIGGIGTLSAIGKDGRFLAFAHPMMNYGPVALPLTEAEIIRIIPSIESPFKLGNIGDIIGIVTQDRPEAIGGRIGLLAPAMSYKISFNDIDNGTKTVKHFQTTADPFIGPTIGSMGMYGIVDDLIGRKGSGTAILKYKIYGGNLKKGWERRNIFFSDTDLTGVLLTEFDTLSQLFALNPFQEIHPFGADLDVEVTKDPRVVFIEKLDIVDKKEEYAPGDKITLDITMRPWRKQAKINRITLTVPEKAVGLAEITVRGGGIEEPEQTSLEDGLRSITDLPTLMRELSVKEANNQIIAEINGPQIPGQEDPSIKDLMDDRLLSEIKAEKTKEHSLVIIDTNYYVDGILRKFVKIKPCGKNRGLMNIPNTSVK